MAADSMHPVLISDLLGISGQYKHLFYTWFGMGLIVIAGLVLRTRIKMVPTGLQNVLEVVIGGLESFAVTTGGEKARKFIPILAGIFIYLLVLNLMGLVPGFDAPTANINTNLCMALFVFVLYNAVGIKTWGAGYVKHFMGPMKAITPLMLPIEIVSHLVRPVSLTLRLFGNIRGEEIVLMLFFVMAPIISTLPIYFLFLLAKVLQAFIFYMLTMIYLQGAYEHAH